MPTINTLRARCASRLDTKDAPSFLCLNRVRKPSNPSVNPGTEVLRLADTIVKTRLKPRATVARHAKVGENDSFTSESKLEIGSSCFCAKFPHAPVPVSRPAFASD